MICVQVLRKSPKWGFFDTYSLTDGCNFRDMVSFALLWKAKEQIVPMNLVWKLFYRDPTISAPGGAWNKTDGRNR